MQKEDFEFYTMIEPYKDCWFKISGDTQKELTEKYMEQSMIGITEAVYSLEDHSYGLKRQFPFNFDVIKLDDKKLAKILREVAEAAYVKNKKGEQ